MDNLFDKCNDSCQSMIGCQCKEGQPTERRISMMEHRKQRIANGCVGLLVTRRRKVLDTTPSPRLQLLADEAEATENDDV